MSSAYIEAKRARRARKKAIKAAQEAPLLVGNYTIECIKCGNPGPGKTLAKRVKVCKNCWADLTRTERRNICGFAAHVG